MKKKKKMNSYLKYGLLILASASVGAVIGGSINMFGLDSLGEQGFGAIYTFVQEQVLWIMGALMVLSVLVGEYNLWKQRSLVKSLENAEDEEADVLDDAFEVTGAWGTVMSYFSMVIGAVLLSAVVSRGYIESSSGSQTFTMTLLFLWLYCYEGFWQVRMVKTVQKAYPERLGDPASRHFRKDWLASCDEQEREVIYKSAYKAYTVNMSLYSVLLVIAMLSHMLWDTGVLAVVLVGVIWCATAVVYCHACVTNRRRIREK